ncbi:ribonuclease III [Mycoplasmopsis gallopavonis]|uniref:Ribonuclease 3 n=1 Tax=Mycoplasmopsis gallopavonis TaxID=76629 RepID=A0A449AYR8_9BACT|nr:ribonuclease III [Mycoplasmopsis gallopavonis]VEU72650.1 Ribonuclease III [Mycoplasmopsis gallopavonis]
MNKATSLNEFLELHEITPNNSLTFIQALTHSSFNKGGTKKVGNYEQLEFLGDAVLQFISSAYIFRKYPDLAQGFQTRLRAKAVCTDTLSEISREIGLIDILKTGPGQMSVDVKGSHKVQADVFESIVGAIYFDQGITKARDFIAKYIYPVIDQIHSDNNKDAKSELQEYFQSFSKENITYITEQLDDKRFFAKAQHDKKFFGKGYGNTKKEAELAAAQDALSKLKEFDLSEGK